LALGKPRRIFVRSPRRRWRRFGVVILTCAGLLAIGARGGALPAAGSIARPAASPPPDAVSGKNVAVVDGETLRLDGRVVRRVDKKKGQGALPPGPKLRTSP